MDHLKFALPKVGILQACDPDELTHYLHRRRDDCERLFDVERPSRRRIRIVFRGSKWLFNLQLSIGLIDGRWTGAGDLDLNPTRLVRSVGLHHGLPTEHINVFHLMRTHEQTPLPDTLDGKDNYIPDVLVPEVIQLDWPSLVQNYAAAVLQNVAEVLGTLHDYDIYNPQHLPFVQLPSLHDWTLRYAEVYVELREPEALLQVAAISEHGRSLANLFSAENHGRVPTTSEMRVSNMPAMLIKLGAEGVDLSVYAKTFERLRVEVRYKKYPMRLCRLNRSSYPKSPAFIAQVLRDVRANAMQRTTKFLQGYDRSRGSAPLSCSHLSAF